MQGKEHFESSKFMPLKKVDASKTVLKQHEIDLE